MPPPTTPFSHPGLPYPPPNPCNLVQARDSVHSGLTIPLVEFKDGFRDLDGLSEELDVR